MGDQDDGQAQALIDFAQQAQNRLRPAGAGNANMASGMIEVLGYELEVLNEAETPPASATSTRSSNWPAATA